MSLGPGGPAPLSVARGSLVEPLRYHYVLHDRPASRLPTSVRLLSTALTANDGILLLGRLRVKPESQMRLESTHCLPLERLVKPREPVADRHISSIPPAVALPKQ